MPLFRKLRAASICCCLIGQAGAAHAEEQSQYQQIARSIRSEIKAERLTGVSVALVQDGQIVWEDGFGWADREAQLKATSRTPFSIASTTKPITTTALMTLVESGKLALDTPANEYLGAEKIRAGNVAAQRVTLRHLATHSSGLPTFFAMFPENVATQPPSIAQIIRDYGYVIALPGEYYEYSNMGFGIIADIVARRSGQDFGSYLQSNVFAPLHMEDSFLDTQLDRRREMAPRYADDGTRLPFYLTATPGSGEVYASARDLARFASLHLKSDVGKTGNVLSAARIDELHRPATPIASHFDYAMGWQVYSPSQGPRVLYHGGGQSGVATEFVLVPDKGVACIVLSNRRGGKFLQGVRDAMLRTLVPGWEGIPMTPAPEVGPLAPAKDYLGTWRGRLIAQGRAIPIELRITSPTTVSLSLAGEAPQPVSEVGLVSGWLSGETHGAIGTPDTRREKLEALALNLKRRGNRIAGEIVAWRKTSTSMTMLPHWTELERVKPDRVNPPKN
jgi:CubicO group peptidase (beta-lactamase class C family)